MVVHLFLITKIFST